MATLRLSDTQAWYTFIPDREPADVAAELREEGTTPDRFAADFAGRWEGMFPGDEMPENLESYIVAQLTR